MPKFQNLDPQLHYQTFWQGKGPSFFSLNSIFQLKMVENILPEHNHVSIHLPLL